MAFIPYEYQTGRMGSDTQIPVSEETRDMIRDEKDKFGMSYDGYLKRIVGEVDPVTKEER